MRHNIHICLSFSLIAHILIFMWLGIGTGNPSPRPHQEISKSISLSLTRLKPAPQLPAATTPQPSGEHSATKASSNPEFSEPVNSLRAFMSGELDSPLAPTNNIDIEPEYGFSDDAKGSVQLILVIDETGKTLWVINEKSALDAATINYITDAFKQAQFSQPRVNGKPVKAILRIELTIGDVSASRAL